MHREVVEKSSRDAHGAEGSARKKRMLDVELGIVIETNQTGGEENYLYRNKRTPQCTLSVHRVSIRNPDW